MHVHEPVTPVVGWDVLTSADAPLVGTFHCYSESRPPHAIAALMGARRKLNHLAVRIAVSDAASWTGRRFYGGEYRVIPNGVVVPDGGAPAPRRRAPGEPLEIAFVGQAVERKGLPVLLRAFEALREHVPAQLTIVGASESEVAPLLVDRAGVTVLGRVSDEEKRAALVAADVLAAPSLGGESFGMVLTESFAAGTPVVASDIAGYRDVVARRRRRPARAARRRDGPGRDPARPRARPGAHADARRVRRGERRPLRMAEGGRPGRRGLRRRARRAASRRARGSAPRSGSACGPPTSARGGRRSASPSLEPAPAVSASRRTGRCCGAAAGDRGDRDGRRRLPRDRSTSASTGSAARS